MPSGKLIGEETFSIVSDYIGRPIQSYNEQGELIWQTDYDIYGALRNLKGEKQFIPFRQLGQYEDEELEGGYYNFHRYYSPETGTYISQDPIGLMGGSALYSYVSNTNSLVDIFGLAPWATGGFNQWFNNASVQDIVDNKKSVESALRAPGGKHEMFPVSMAPKAKELGFSAEEIKAMSVDTKKITFVDVPDGNGNLLEGKHHSSSASSIFHNNLMDDLSKANTKQDALDIIKKHHDAHMKISCH